MLQITHHLEELANQEIHQERENTGHDQGNEGAAEKDHLVMTETEDIVLHTDVDQVPENDEEIDPERGTGHERKGEVVQEIGNTVNAADHPDDEVL